MNGFDTIEGPQGAEREHLNEGPREQPHDVKSHSDRNGGGKEKLDLRCQPGLDQHSLQYHRACHGKAVQKRRTRQDISSLVGVAFILQEGVDGNKEKGRSKASPSKRHVKQGRLRDGKRYPNARSHHDNSSQRIEPQFDVPLIDHGSQDTS